MSSENANDETDTQDGAHAGHADPETLEQLAHDILDDCLQNIIHDIVLEVHRKEKIARMQSAAIIVEQAAIAAAAAMTADGSRSTTGDTESPDDPSKPLSDEVDDDAPDSPLTPLSDDLDDAAPESPSKPLSNQVDDTAPGSPLTPLLDEFDKSAPGSPSTHLSDELDDPAPSSPSTPLSDEFDGTAAPMLKISTPAAVYDHGKVYLKGNPLETTKEVYCPQCRLPRLLYPTDGIGARKPEPGKIYCAKHPYINKSGHDIYGNPFPSHNAKGSKSKTKKSEAQRESTPTGSKSCASSPPNETTDQQNSESARAVAFPNVDCPNCKRSIGVTMLAQHLEKCLGIGGRKSSRSAATRMTSQSANASTTSGSKRGTPAPKKRSRKDLSNEDDQGDQADNDSNDEDDDYGKTPKKKKRTKAPPKVTTKKRLSKPRKLYS